MPGKSKSSRRLITFIIVTMMAMFIVFASRHERAASPSRRQADLDRHKVEIEKFNRNKAALPRAEYAASESDDPTPRQIRKARDKQYREGQLFEDLPGDATEVTRVTREPFEPRGLPVEQSDLIVVGTIANTRGYVTEDKSSAYSEYTVNVTDVFKGEAKLSGSQIIAERFGATVMLPSGRTLPVYDANRGTPEVSHRYALFLKYSPEGQDYLIVTAYDLRDGKVMSIDRFPQCEFFDGNAEAAFLELVRSTAK